MPSSWTSVHVPTVVWIFLDATKTACGNYFGNGDVSCTGKVIIMLSHHFKKGGNFHKVVFPPFKNFQKSLEELYSIVGDVALIHQSLHEPFTDVGFGIGFQTDPFAFGRYVVERFTRSHIEQIDPVDARYRF